MWKKKKIRKIIAQAVLVAMVAVSAKPAASDAKSVSVKANNKSVSVSLYVGKSVTLKVTGSRKVSWSSKNKKIAVVSRSGKVTAKSAGNTKIEGKTGAKKITCKVTVGNYITGMKIQSASAVTLAVGETSQIKASVTGKKPLDKGVVYTSGDKSVAKVSSSGKVTAVGAGLTEITVKTKAVNKKGKSYSKKVAVYVAGEEAPKPTAVPVPSGNSPVISSGSAVVPGTSTNPSGGVSQTLLNAISQMGTPGADQLVAGTFVVSENNNTETVYFLNRNYSGTMRLTAFGYPLNSSKSVVDALNQIVSLKNTSVYITSNGERVLLLSDKLGNCAVKNLVTGEVVTFQVYETDTFYGTGYGLIIANGDTRDKIQVQ